MLAFVTFLFDIARPADCLGPGTTYFSQLCKRLVALLDVLPRTSPVVLWLDPEHTFTHDHPGLRTVHFPCRDFDAFKAATSALRDGARLPAQRSHSKDTFEYLALMNCKTECLARTSKYLKDCGVDVQTLMYIDAGVCKMLVDVPRTRTQFLRLTAQTYDRHKLTAPGCWTLPKAMLTGVDKVSWRFCGTTCIVCAEDAQEVSDTLFKYFQELVSTTGVLTWEVNVWAYAESKAPHVFRWTSGDHNNSLLDI